VTDKTDAKCLREGAAHEGEETLLLYCDRIRS
jgi:hypothetical protein